ncbi:hypothetical protein COLO4_29305 [Corchorus olitorius]|uniref:Uncharacterized protein n=1 Tax=Corchorus olitorius TaxID=93759 RepID=A0A1R3HFF6_9ROSI|nr:hypothetical protein COLO4_29305 [Corchorus olitorius]
MTSRRRSREKAAAPTEPIRSPDPRFTSNDNYKWYKDQLGKKFIEETHVPEELDNLYGVTASFDVLGWTPILGLPKDYFPDLVREFYANLEEREKDICVSLHSTVAGVAIEITERKLNTWFGLNLYLLRILTMSPQFRALFSESPKVKASASTRLPPSDEAGPSSSAPLPSDLASRLDNIEATQTDFGQAKMRGYFLQILQHLGLQPPPP